MPATPLVRQVLNTITFHDLLWPDARVLVHCRGDAPGVALVHALADLGPAFGFDLTLTLVHVSRPLSLEPTDGESAAEVVVRLAEERGFEARLERLDATPDRPHEETRALLASVAKEVEAGAVATADLADDRAEAVLAAILRGHVTPADLAGLPIRERLADPEGPCLVRPLYGTSRDEVINDLRGRNVDVDDLPPQPAADAVLHRVRIELLPRLQRRYNPRIREALLRLADSAANHRGA